MDCDQAVLQHTHADCKCVECCCAQSSACAPWEGSCGAVLQRESVSPRSPTSHVAADTGNSSLPGFKARPLARRVVTSNAARGPQQQHSSHLGGFLLASLQQETPSERSCLLGTYAAAPRRGLFNVPRSQEEHTYRSIRGCFVCFRVRVWGGEARRRELGSRSRTFRHRSSFLSPPACAWLYAARDSKQPRRSVFLIGW